MLTFGDLRGEDRHELAQLLAQVAVAALADLHSKPKQASDNAALAVFSSDFYCEAYEKGLLDEKVVTQVRVAGHYQSQVLMEMLLKYRETAEQSTKYACDCREWIAKAWALEPWAAVERLMLGWLEQTFLAEGSPFGYLPIHKERHIKMMQKEEEEEEEEHSSGSEDNNDRSAAEESEEDEANESDDGEPQTSDEESGDEEADEHASGSDDDDKLPAPKRTRKSSP